MMNIIILGLLSKKDMTVYDSKIALDQSISNFYSNSFGSINPAIKKLEKEQLITCTQHIEKSRLKKTYKITDLGIKNYSEWISEPIKQGRLKDEGLIRIFFLGDSKPQDQHILIKDYLEEIAQSKRDLEQLKKDIEARNLSPQDTAKIKFQMSTLQYGIDYMMFKHNWFQNLSNSL